MNCWVIKTDQSHRILQTNQPLIEVLHRIETEHGERVEWAIGVPAFQPTDENDQSRTN